MGLACCLRAYRALVEPLLTNAMGRGLRRGCRRAPAKGHGIGVSPRQVLEDPALQLLDGVHPDPAESLSRELGEKHLDEVEPRRVGRGKDEGKAAGACRLVDADEQRPRAKSPVFLVPLQRPARAGGPGSPGPGGRPGSTAPSA